jgi:transcriptional regulator with XRE-family HTH domain
MRVTDPGAKYREAVAGAVRSAMSELGITQQNLADATGLKQQYISRRVTGETAFDVEDLALIAAALGVPVASLMPADQTAA